ncbi:alpha/beta hydrolase, partial [Acinetobacter seifertii]
MTRLSASIKASMKKTATVLTIASCSLFSVMSISQAQAADNIDINFQTILQQERSWAGLQSKKLKVGDITWSYSEGGSSTKPTLLLIHGLGGSRDNWNRVAHYLTTNYHVIIPDLPGSGETIVAQDFDYSVPNLAEKLRRFVEAENLKGPIHIAGHSLGGSIALLYAGQYPFETKSLFLVDSGGIFRSANTIYLKDPTYLKQLLV